MASHPEKAIILHTFGVQEALKSDLCALDEGAQGRLEGCDLAWSFRAQEGLGLRV